MQKKGGNKIRLGIFVATGTALLIAAIYLIGERQEMFSSTFRVSGIFKDISGLLIGNNVRLAGLNIGVVERVTQITDSTVQVDMVINERSHKFIKKSAGALIGSDGLMGNKIVVITPGGGSKEVIEENGMINTVRPVSLDEILIKVKVTADNAADITGDLSKIMKNITSGRGTMGKLFFDSAFSRNVEQTMTNIKNGAGGFKQNMDAASHNVLLRGYLKRKNRKEQKRKDRQEKADD